jgi:hypothetical protein
MHFARSGGVDVTPGLRRPASPFSSRKNLKEILMNKLLTAALLTAGLLLTTFVRAEPQSRQVPVPDYTVFVDPPTRFVFVKLPTGWKFAGRIEAQDMDHLPGAVEARGWNGRIGRHRTLPHA